MDHLAELLDKWTTRLPYLWAIPGFIAGLFTAALL